MTLIGLRGNLISVPQLSWPGRVLWFFLQWKFFFLGNGKLGPIVSQQENEVCHKVYLARPSQSGPFDEAE